MLENNSKTKRRIRNFLNKLINTVPSGMQWRLDTFSNGYAYEN